MGLALNECPKCNGLWVPGDHFDLLVSRAIEAHRNASPEQRLTLKPRVVGANPASQRVSYRQCPECQGYMQRRNYQRSSGVIIDRCKEHGSWLDADELEQIAGFILSGGGPSPTLTEPSAAERRVEAEFARATSQRVFQRHRSWNEPDGTTAGSILNILTRLLT